MERQIGWFAQGSALLLLAIAMYGAPHEVAASRVLIGFGIGLMFYFGGWFRSLPPR